MFIVYFFVLRYVGVCCGIKLMALLIFLLDWWLIRNRQNAEKKEAALTVGEVVNSIISLDKRKNRVIFRASCVRDIRANRVLLLTRFRRRQT